MKKISDKYLMLFNVLASFFWLFINTSINLVVMPHIVNTVGSEAYGFVNLANNIINYATIITVALNSVASRFITIEVHKGNEKTANEYFNSVFWGDVIICIFIAIIGITFSVFVDRILNIPSNLIHSVRSLFLWLLCNLVLSVVGTVYTVSTYITNKLYLSNLINALAIIIKAILLVVLYNIFPTDIVYIGIASFVYSLIVLFANSILLNKLTPNLTFSIKNVSVKKIKEMMASGIWSSVTKLSSVLSDGLDTLITNLFLSAADLGSLSVAYTVPMLASSLIASLCSLFNPKLTYEYAKDNIQGVIGEIKNNMRMTGVFSSTLFCGIVLYGKSFFLLMVPKENIDLIYQLACLSCISIVVSGVTSGLTNVFVLTNKLKINSLVWLSVSFIDSLLVVLLVKHTSLGVFAVAGVSKIVGLVMNLVYLPIYVCDCLKIKKSMFYPLIIKYFGVLLVCFSVMTIIKTFLPSADTWLKFIMCIVVDGVIGIIINGLLLLNRQQRTKLIHRGRTGKNGR